MAPLLFCSWCKMSAWKTKSGLGCERMSLQGSRVQVQNRSSMEAQQGKQRIYECDGGQEHKKCCWTRIKEEEEHSIANRGDGRGLRGTAGTEYKAIKKRHSVLQVKLSGERKVQAKLVITKCDGKPHVSSRCVIYIKTSCKMRETTKFKSLSDNFLRWNM